MAIAAAVTAANLYMSALLELRLGSLHLTAREGLESHAHSVSSPRWDFCFAPLVYMLAARDFVGLLLIVTVSLVATSRLHTRCTFARNIADNRDVLVVPASDGAAVESALSKPEAQGGD